MTQKELKVSAIKEGTVIDHIPPDHTFKVAEILDVANLNKIVSIVSNLRSSRMGKKGIIKVGGLKLVERDVQRIALVAPRATLSIIKNYKVVEKNKLDIPDELNNIIRCFNPQCITNREKVKTKFFVESKKPLQVRCAYCERLMTNNDIELR